MLAPYPYHASLEAKPPKSSFPCQFWHVFILMEKIFRPSYSVLGIHMSNVREMDTYFVV